MNLNWELLIDADMSEDDWQFSAPTSANLLRIDQVDAPEIGRFALAQTTLADFEFLDINAYPARSESTRITLDAVGVDPRRIAIRYRYGQFPEGVANTWQVKIYGASADFQPAVNPSAIVLTFDPRIAGAIPLEEKGIPLGVATLDEAGLIDEDQLPTTGLAELVAANMEATDSLADQVELLMAPFLTQAVREQLIQLVTDEMAIQNAIGNVLRSGIQFILGSDAPGDTYFRSASGPLARLGIGSNGQALVVNAGLPAWGTISSLNWSVITGTSQAAAINSGYIVNAATLSTITLPATAAVGSVIQIVGVGAGGWRLAQAAGQQIVFGNVSNTAGTAGQLNSTHQRDCIRLVNIIADTTWQVTSSIGNIDVI
ncbi:hypothetical protein [Allocoleopsis franciscana]|uniref:Uncharacterized protein n=1 Tax=Allocoleopsis franciscana PCC 7113 TaxID=1173027 RepID=K9WRG2_9CYAN|nr:hypothetical protein [Allocoleopsis franciscana]AFZ22376.1 hypothetical protein Mic7113_6819 [Allocoleopsis franciscana PCC 7113]